MKKHRVLAFSGYAMALFLCVGPLSDAAVSIWPLQLGAITWRYGAVGMVVEALMVPPFGLGVGIGLAMYHGHMGVVRTLAILSGCGALLTVVVAPLFLLDAIQLRQPLAEELKPSFDVATASALAKMMVIVVFGFCVAWGGMRSAHRSHKRRRMSPPPVVVARRPQTSSRSSQ